MSLLALVITLLAAGALEPLEQRVSEVRARLLNRAPTGQLAIVEIDAKSLAALNSWPWPRRYHAQLIDRLRAAGVSMIGFDVDFSARSSRRDDEVFARSLAGSQPVILPIFQQRASDDPIDRTIIKSRPAPPFGSAWVGGVNILPGRDGVVRDFPAATIINGQIQPAMAVLLSENGAMGDRTFIPDWSINAQHIPRFSFIDVLLGRVPAKALRGKRVIVGATAIELGDRYAIPRFGTVPGVVVQAIAVESLLQHRALTRSGFAATIAGLLLVAFLLCAPQKKFGRSFLVVASAVVATLVIGPIAVQSQWPLSIDSASILLAAIGSIVLRLIVEARHRLRVAALADVDSGLPNDRALGARLDEATSLDLCVNAASIERFEAIRSALSSADLTDLVTKCAQRIDQIVGSPVYRVAPDTLAWVTPGQDDAERLCAEVADAFSKPVRAPAGDIDVAWTFGLAAPVRNISSTQLIERAVAAVTEARARGQTRHWFRGMAANAVRDLSMMGELRRGIDQGQLFLVYQPKLDLRTGAISHAEALLRWNHPKEGLVPPDRFMPLAEETGVVREITRFVLRRALAELQRADQLSAIGVSVNVSAADIGHSEFADEVTRMVADADIDPARLTLEITESAIIGSKEVALQVLHRVRDHGVRLSIDDYGTGQSTLSYLKTLPVDELKIDKMFVTRLSENESDRILVRSTIDLAHELGLSVVAEGVEDWATARVLTDLGCDYAQGFAVGRGMPFAELQSLSERRIRKAA